MSVRETPPTNSACLIIAEHPPESYSPAGERLRHMALAAVSFFSKTIVLTSGKAEKQGKRDVDAKALLYKTGVVRSIPYPISALFDPIRLLALFIYGLVLSTRYKPSCIFASMPPIETGASAWLLAGLLQKKLIIDLRDDWESSLEVQLKRRIPLKLLKLSFKIANRIYSSSKAILVATPTITDIVRRRNVYAPIISVPNGANTAIFFPRNENSRREIRLRYALPLNKIVFMYCGSGGNPYYRLDTILLSVTSLPNDAKNRIFFVFYLYGEIELYRKMKDRLKISDDLVEIRGPMRRIDLSEVMGASDVGLVPFDDKSYLLCARSTRLYEYLSVGLYVISSGPQGGELDSFFSQNVDCGIFVQPKVEDFVGAFLNVVKNAGSLLENDCRNLRHSFVEENYDSRKTMTKAMTCLSNQNGVSK